MVLNVYESEKATVIIHSGKMTEEERMAVIGQAAREFYRAIQRDKARKSDASRGKEVGA